MFTFMKHFKKSLYSLFSAGSDNEGWGPKIILITWLADPLPKGA